jgi:dipeptidyl aminopeptidase/acylaminoacyl peptidase
MVVNFDFAEQMCYDYCDGDCLVDNWTDDNLESGFQPSLMGDSPSQVPERYFERTPINFVAHIRGKLLIIQGAQDPNVTPQNVAEVIGRLDQASIPYEVLTFEDEGHGIL